MKKTLRTKAHTIKNGPISEIQNILMGQQASTHAIQIIFFLEPLSFYEHLSITFDFKHWCQRYQCVRYFIKLLIKLRKIIFNKSISITDNISSSVEFCSCSI